MKLRITLLSLATLLIAAHFLRYGNMLPMLACLAAPFILFTRKKWSVRVVQVLSVAAAITWLGTLYGIIQVRILEGRSWTASAIILGVVATFTLVSGWMLNSPSFLDKFQD